MKGLTEHSGTNKMNIKPRNQATFASCDDFQMLLLELHTAADSEVKYVVIYRIVSFNDTRILGLSPRRRPVPALPFPSADKTCSGRARFPADVSQNWDSSKIVYKFHVSS